jgi:hypothetical protein
MRTRRRLLWFALFLAGCAPGYVILAGCSNGSFYWTRPGATPDAFLADHKPCFDTASKGYGMGSEDLYKACMRSKGWTRVQGTGSQPPSVPHFRGPEGDDEFNKDFTPGAMSLEERCQRWRAGLDRHIMPPDCPPR